MDFIYNNMWQLSVQYPTRTRTISLENEDQKSVARAMVEQRMDSLATASYRLVPEGIERAVARKIAQECQDLCSTKRNSLLRRSSVKDLTLFSQAQFMQWRSRGLLQGVTTS